MSTPPSSPPAQQEEEAPLVLERPPLVPPAWYWHVYAQLLLALQLVGWPLPFHRLNPTVRAAERAVAAFHRLHLNQPAERTATAAWDVHQLICRSAFKEDELGLPLDTVGPDAPSEGMAEHFARIAQLPKNCQPALFYTTQYERIIAMRRFVLAFPMPK